jgi:hypothetical protein
MLLYAGIIFGYYGSEVACEKSKVKFATERQVSVARLQCVRDEMP